MDDKAAVLAAGRSRYRPQGGVVHKPKNGQGSALKIQLRLEPEYVDGKGYYEKGSLKKGGLFLQIAPETGVPDANNNPTFDWQDPTKFVIAKLGVADMTQLLVAYDRVRRQGLDVPAVSRPKGLETNNLTVNLFHKNPKGGSTIIQWKFDPERSSLSISKGKDHRQQISLLLHEELIFIKYLERGLDAYFDVGKR